MKILSETTHAFPQMPIRDLRPGNKVDSIYHLLSLEQRTKKNGEPFFMMQLADASGQVNAVMWDNHADLMSGSIERDHFVHVMADAGEYNNKLQMTVKRLVRVEDEDVELRHFLPVSPRPRAEMEEELDAWIARVQDADCKKLLDKVFGHDRLREMYCAAPAAVRIHQAYIHGLLEHTLNVMKLADGMASIYEPVNRDILITGTLVHDIGKIRELDWRRTLTYTSEGRLLGHIPMGASMIDSLITKLKQQDGFDPETHHQILHMILSHHGRLEWGSPITPKTREAMVLHYADHAEAYMTVFKEETERARDRGETWTPWNRIFESYLYAGTGAPTGPSAGGEEEPLFQSEKKPDPADDVYPAR